MARLIRLDQIDQFAAINLTLDPGAVGGPKIIDQAAEIVLGWGLEDGKIAHNVLIGRYAGAFSGTQAQANSMLTALSTGAQWTAMAAFMSNTTTLGAVSIRNIDLRDQPVIPSNSAGAPGTSASAALPNEVAICVTLRTAFTGPQNRGRMFVPGFATNALGAGNVIAAGAVTAVANWASIIAGVLSAQGYTWCVGHVARAAYTGSTGTQHPARLDGTVPITTTAVRDNHWDTQRRRGLK